MQDPLCVSVYSKFSFEAAAVGQERKLQLLTSVTADMKSAEEGYYLPHGQRPNGAPALESPRIEITAYSQYPEDEVEESKSENHIIKRGMNSIVTLTLPNADGYRDPSCLSPASSISSRSCNSEASSYEVSVTDENWLANANQYTNSAIVAAINALTTDGVVDMGEGIPIKTRKTMIDHSPSMSLKMEPGGEDLCPEGELCHDDYTSRLSLKKENYCGGFLDVPQHPFSWSKPKPYLR
ncbi:unnamed protein product [Lampetra planeri]